MGSIMSSPVAVIRFETWEEAFVFGRGLQNWFFRGQEDASWSLSTTLERDIGVNRGDTTHWDHCERWLLHKFKGAAHHYLSRY